MCRKRGWDPASPQMTTPSQPLACISHYLMCDGQHYEGSPDAFSTLVALVIMGQEPLAPFLPLPWPSVSVESALSSMSPIPATACDCLGLLVPSWPFLQPSLHTWQVLPLTGLSLNITSSRRPPQTPYFKQQRGKEEGSTVRLMLLLDITLVHLEDCQPKDLKAATSVFLRCPTSAPPRRDRWIQQVSAMMTMAIGP